MTGMGTAVDGKYAAQVLAADGKICLDRVVQAHRQQKFPEIHGFFPDFLVEQLVGQKGYVVVGIQDGQDVVHVAVIVLIFAFLRVGPVDGVDRVRFIGLALFLEEEKIGLLKEDDGIQMRKKLFHPFVQEYGIVVQIRDHLINVFDF